MTATAKLTYIECDIYDIPEGVRFDVPGRNQGQIVGISYGDFGRSEHGRGDKYMCRWDRSDNSVQYYRREDIPAATSDVRRARQQRERDESSSRG